MRSIALTGGILRTGHATRCYQRVARADHLDPARRRRIDDGGLGRRYPGEQVRANLANQPYRSVLLAIQAWAISDRLRGVGAGLDRLARARARGANQRGRLWPRKA
jgi:hypothetical protein